MKILTICNQFVWAKDIVETLIISSFYVWLYNMFTVNIISLILKDINRILRLHRHVIFATTRCKCTNVVFTALGNNRLIHILHSVCEYINIICGIVSSCTTLESQQHCSSDSSKRMSWSKERIGLKNTATELTVESSKISLSNFLQPSEFTKPKSLLSNV